MLYSQHGYLQSLLEDKILELRFIICNIELVILNIECYRDGVCLVLYVISFIVNFTILPKNLILFHHYI